MLLSSRPWRSIAYLVARLPLPAIGAALVLVAAFGDAPLLALPVLLVTLAAAVSAAPLERRLVTILRRPPVARARPQARTVVHAGLSAALAPLEVLLLLGWSAGSLALVAAPALLSEAPVAAGPWTVDTTAEAWVAVPAGAALLVAGAYAVVAVAELHAYLARELLGPREAELQRRVTELTRSRLRLVDAFDVERRRIERDLHDGAQQELVALAMTLDLARIELEGSPHGEARRLVDHAHAQATSTMTKLRELIHEIHPPVLADRGLPGALETLAERSPLPVTTRAELPRRPAESVETAAYFVLAEALANAGKHSRAPAVEIDVRLRNGTLALTVTDDGVGGATASDGGGLSGLGDRIAAVGGRLTLSSPPGGPTIVQAEIPCP